MGLFPGIFEQVPRSLPPLVLLAFSGSSPLTQLASPVLRSLPHGMLACSLLVPEILVHPDRLRMNGRLLNTNPRIYSAQKGVKYLPDKNNGGFYLFK